MPGPSHAPNERTSEAERLIDLARAFLNRPEEEIVVNYLDHALEALQIISEAEAEQIMPVSEGLALKSLAMARVPNHD